MLPGRVAKPLRLVICGGGASAVLLLTALRRQFTRRIEVTVLEPREQLGVGVAYSTQCPLHLLNTRAGNMSATDNPNDFLQWLRRERPRRMLDWTQHDFAPRLLYGQYLQARLQDVQNAPNIQFEWMRSRADCIQSRDDEWEIVPACGVSVRADVVVLASGNEAPRPIGARLAPQVRPLILDDPWDAAAKVPIKHTERVLFLGSGLTALDKALELLHRGHAGPIYAVSRHGLTPRSHASLNTRSESSGATLPTSVHGLVRHVRAIIERDLSGSKWQDFVNELRAVAPALWAQWNPGERRRFLRHVRPFWDVYRHRIAPQVNSRIARSQARGQFTVMRGRIQDIQSSASKRGVQVRIRERGGERLLEVDRVINCTGPEMDPRRSVNPLLRNLVSDSLAQADALGLGLLVDGHSRLIAADGHIHRTLYALGPITRGSRWEITAVAEIREQASEVARKLVQDFAEPAEPSLRLAEESSYRHSAA